jgi:hypothetical protein
VLCLRGARETEGDGEDREKNALHGSAPFPG